MKMPTIVAVTIAISLSAPAFAEDGGCLKYGAAGAAAGHFVGSGHAVAGATAGCIAGMWRRHESRKENEREEQRVTDELNHTSHHEGTQGLQNYSGRNGYTTDGYHQQSNTWNGR